MCSNFCLFNLTFLKNCKPLKKEKEKKPISIAVVLICYFINKTVFLKHVLFVSTLQILFIQKIKKKYMEAYTYRNQYLGYLLKSFYSHQSLKTMSSLKEKKRKNINVANKVFLANFKGNLSVINLV